MIEAPLVAPPFSYTFTPSIPELLQSLQCSLAMSTYQAGKIVLISPLDKERLTTLPRSFQRPMGFYVNANQMVLASRNEVITFENSPELAKHYPKKPNTYDSMYVPRVTFYSGSVDMHDIAIGNEGIWAVNTSFSCLCIVNGQHNFVPRWKPSFISELTPDDRCHLNGLVMKDGTPKYVTALGQTNTPAGWRDNITEGGVLIDVETNEIILDKLAMPHSPMLHNGELYMLLSATGEFIKVDHESKSYEVIRNLKGFCRGLDIIGDYAFIGMSKLRKNSSTFSKLSFSDTAKEAGIKVVHIPTKSLVGEIEYKASVEEIYEVKILHNTIRPNILNTIDPIHENSLAIPGTTYWSSEEYHSNITSKQAHEAQNRKHPS